MKVSEHKRDMIEPELWKVSLEKSVLNELERWSQGQVMKVRMKRDRFKRSPKKGTSVWASD